MLDAYIQESHGKQLLKIIINSSIHLEHVIEDALDMSRLENNKFVINKSLFNLKTIIQEVIDVLKF